MHPHLAPVAAIAARWRRQESFHAGAVILGDGAWAVMGAKGSGKSSLLAWLALSGHPILTDDLLVIDADGNGLCRARGRSTFARAALGGSASASRWASSAPASATAWCVAPVPAAVPLRGFIRLALGRRTDRDAGAARHGGRPPWRRSARCASIPRDPDLLVNLSALPMVELRRPCEWGARRTPTLPTGSSAGRWPDGERLGRLLGAD